MYKVFKSITIFLKKSEKSIQETELVLYGKVCEDVEKCFKMCKDRTNIEISTKVYKITSNIKIYLKLY